MYVGITSAFFRGGLPWGLASSVFLSSFFRSSKGNSLAVSLDGIGVIRS